MYLTSRDFLTCNSFYVNTPGYSTEEACIWGDKSKPIGNWAPYVVGGQTTANGETFYKIGWNPIYCNDFPGVLPDFGVKIECSGSGCNGVPCSIDPSVVGYGGVTSADSASGAGGANFCVVTIPAGGTANVVVFAAGNSNAGSGSQGASNKHSAAPAPSTSAPAPSSTPPPTTPPSAAPTMSKASHYISLLPSSSVNTTSPTPTPNLGAILFQNDSETSSSAGAAMASGTGYSTANLTAPSPVPSTTRKSGAPEKLTSGSFLGFVILFAAAGYLL